MTLIVAYQDAGEVMMCADSGFFGDSEYVISDTSKLVRAGPLLLGVSGNMAALTWLRNKSHGWPPGPGDEKYIYYHLALPLSEKFDGGLDSDGDDDYDVLVASSAGMWIVQPGPGIIKVNTPYAAIGAGSAAALGALHALEEQELDILTRLGLAMSGAASVSSHVRRPFKVHVLPR